MSVQGFFERGALMLFESLGIAELALILLVFLVLFGATKVPELARSLGRAKGEFKRGEDQIGREIDDDRIRRQASDLGIDTTGKTTFELRREIEARSAHR